MKEEKKNNIVEIVGKLVISPDNIFIDDIECMACTISAKRKSGYSDIVPVAIPLDLIGRIEKIRCWAKITGKYVTQKVDNRIYINILAEKIEIYSKYTENYNTVNIDGKITKIPVLRKTHLGKTIAEVQIETHDGHIANCIAWNKVAEFMNGLEVGTNIALKGRIQSRQYRKYIGDNTDCYRTGTAYEISIIHVSDYKRENRRHEL